VSFAGIIVGSAIWWPVPAGHTPNTTFTSVQTALK